MKTLYLFCTKLRMYLSEIPLILLFTVVYHYNGYHDGLLKFYPLMVVIGLTMLFILLYFFRMISLSFDEVRDHGLFSSRDRAILNKDKKLVIEVHPHRILRVYVYGLDGGVPELPWTGGEDYVQEDLCLFRGKALGGLSTVRRILTFYGADKETADALLSGDTCAENDLVAFDSRVGGDFPTFRITFKVTLEKEDLDNPDKKK